MTESAHEAWVDAWLERIPKELPPDQDIAFFEQAVDAVFRRVHVTLGDVTLGAIADHVLYTTCERYPQLAPLQIEADRVRWDELRARAGSFDRGSLREALRFLLVEFLTILGSLTAEILTPALREELSKVVAESRDTPETPESDDGDGATSS